MITIKPSQNRFKNFTWILAGILFVSVSINIFQHKLRNRADILADLDRANSNTIIAGKTSEIEQKQAAIESIRKERTVDSLVSTKKIGALNVKLARYEKKLSTLPKTVPYSPDSAMVDSLRLAFIFKDSTIDTQKLKIAQLETDITAQFESFSKEIKETQEQRAAQVDISNQLQNKLVDEQGKTRKAERGKRFWKRTAGVITVVAATVVTIVTLKE